jgi:hypothetical protein
LKTKPTKRALVEGENTFVEEHQISLKTNKGAQHMNVWIKMNPSFDSDDALDNFMSEAQGLVVMCDAPRKYAFQDLPKFLIYALQMFVPRFGDKPQVNFVVFGKREKEEQNDVDNTPAGIKFKKVRTWR